MPGGDWGLNTAFLDRGDHLFLTQYIRDEKGNLITELRLINAKTGELNRVLRKPVPFQYSGVFDTIRRSGEGGQPLPSDLEDAIIRSYGLVLETFGDNILVSDPWNQIGGSVFVLRGFSKSKGTSNSPGKSKD
ncbi:MAG: hypothetical protein IIC80_06950 [Chloroflexi bacterium]|nr:hypothetical protein [Chloroflexota bacterium]